MFEGIVVDGLKEARALGYPTANLPLQDSDVAEGVYAGFVYVEGAKYLSAVVVTSVEDKKKIEAHLINISIDLYNKNIKIQLLKKIRDYIRGLSINDLKNQIKQDISNIKYEYQK